MTRSVNIFKKISRMFTAGMSLIIVLLNQEFPWMKVNSYHNGGGGDDDDGTSYYT